MKKTYDLIIVGGGLVGLSTAYNATSYYGGYTPIKGENILVLEESTFFNQNSSTAGASRQFRLQYSENYMSKLVLESMYEWKKLQKHSLHPLISHTGCLWFGDPIIPTTEGGIIPAIDTMDKLGIPYQSLSAKEIENLYLFKNIPTNYTGFFQGDGGIINIPATLKTLYNVAYNRGVHLKENCPIIRIDSDKKEVIVTSEGNVFHGKKVVIAAGPYTNKLLSSLGIYLDIEIWDMISAYFCKKDCNIDYPTWFVFQKDNEKNSNLYYGFPEAYWKNPGYIRVAPDYPFNILEDPEQRTLPTDNDLIGTSNWVKNHMKGLDPEPKLTSTCMLALPKNGQLMYLDSLDTSPNIVVYTAGWGAKFAPLLGKICAQ
ncbi:FAD-dependent oxidoreductase [Xenorhabdus kozodoii]|uniref:N-methyl-L-tryptophan oxidase n=1 Tax=Xenorhabdus kozodoii TaxID=351676 RepID=A0A2D0LG13_9GAMM|nr:FAD-dependent oxidoreductase [Xenorhabdus kozodoii]PHM74591.1 N-methyl-L-tryptophan oxidase [Xenorhabdus kozodoii]